jgi:hypothetical protein
MEGVAALLNHTYTYTHTHTPLICILTCRYPYSIVSYLQRLEDGDRLPTEPHFLTPGRGVRRHIRPAKARDHSFGPFFTSLLLYSSHGVGVCVCVAQQNLQISHSQTKFMPHMQYVCSILIIYITLLHHFTELYLGPSYALRIN